MCVCVREKERECVCVCERERGGLDTKGCSTAPGR